LRFLVSKNIIVIPKSERVERLKENFHSFDFEIEKADLDKILKLDRNHRVLDPYDNPHLNKLPLFY